MVFMLFLETLFQVVNGLKVMFRHFIDSAFYLNGFLKTSIVFPGRTAEKLNKIGKICHKRNLYNLITTLKVTIPTKNLKCLPYIKNIPIQTR